MSGKDTAAKLQWQGREPKRIWLSNPWEEPVSSVADKITAPGNGVITLRVEF